MRWRSTTSTLAGLWLSILPINSAIRPLRSPTHFHGSLGIRVLTRGLTWCCWHMNRVAVVGTGAWGTALALQAWRAGHLGSLVGRSREAASTIEASRESRRLPGYRLPDEFEVRHDLPKAADLLLWAAPTQHLRASLMHLCPANRPIVVCAKGVEARTHLLPLEVVDAVCNINPVGVLTGPNFAHEVAAGLPAASVVAASSASLRSLVLSLLGTTEFRLYGNDDPVGAQLGGAAKNVIAIAAGAVIGAGLGENARAALVTRGLSELCRLAVALGGRAETMVGLSGLGDLMLTCTGMS